MRHEYLRPGDEKPPRAAWIWKLLWIGLLGAGGGLAGWTGSVAGAEWAIPLVFALLVAALWLRVLMAGGSRLVRELQAAQLDRLRERIPQALDRCRALLRRRLLPYQRGLALQVIGECAEMEGDFAEAARILVLAEGMFRVSRVHKVVRAQQLAVIAARRAFAHAACGELDQAEATLRTAGDRDGVPLAGPLASRAGLLVLARRGLHQQVLERLVTDGRLLRNSLAFRDRALVAVIGAHATGRPVPAGSIDPAVVPWIASAFPEARATIGSAA